MKAPRYTLLFVDDETDVVELLEQLFSRRYDVLTASTGARALELLRTRHVDLLITDQKMPELTGLELVRSARAEGIDITALLLTGYTDPDDLIAALNSGHIYRYLTKPWEVTDLTQAIQQALEFTQLRRDKARLSRQLERRLEALEVLHEVSRTSLAGPHGQDGLVERALAALARVLPYDCATALVAPEGGRKAILRLRCRRRVGEAGLLGVKEATLAAFEAACGQRLVEGQLTLHVSGGQQPGGEEARDFPSVMHVPLTALGRPLGVLSLFADRPGAWSDEDLALLETLANQTAGAMLALQVSEDDARRRIEGMVASMPEGVLLLDERNVLQVVNPAARALLRLGDDPDGWTGRALAQRLGFEPLERVRRRDANDDPTQRVELRLDARDVHVTMTPVDDGQGRARGVCVTLRDITEQRVNEARKDAFVTMASHELRTPLTSISGALELVLGGLTGTLNEKQTRYLGMARDAGEALNVLVDDLLDLAKLERGRMRMEPEVTWLDDVVSRALERFTPTFLERGITVSQTLPRLRIVADAARLGQVLGNLLTNAVKFTPERGEIRVEVSDAPAIPGFATLSIWNSGDPIGEADLERIFERFEQARSPQTRTIRGTGLGLSISRSIVEAHGGRLWAEPVSRGARFVAVLPLEVPHERPEGPRDEARPHPVRGGAHGTIVVVSAEAPSARVLKALLLSQGHAVLLAEGFEAALSLAAGAALFVLDVPAADASPTLLGSFRSDPRTRETPVLVLAGKGERAGAPASVRVAFLEKPLRADALLASIEDLLRGAPPRRVGGADPVAGTVRDEALRDPGGVAELAGESATAPTTQLPGSLAIEREVQRRLETMEPFALCFVALDRLGEYRDRHGLAKADAVIRQTGDLLRESLAQEGGQGDFLGHIEGEDFFLVTTPSRADPICQRFVASFDRIIPLHHERTGCASGQGERVDAPDAPRPLPRMRVCVVAVMAGPDATPAELARQAAALKRRAGESAGSVYLRSDEAPRRPADVSAG